jgi:hypothetical protein
VGPSAIYSPFFQTSTLSYRSPESLFPNPSSAIRSGSHHIHSHIPQVTIFPRPEGSIFLTSRPGIHAHVQNYQTIVICSLSSDIVQVRYSVLMCAGT